MTTPLWWCLCYFFQIYVTVLSSNLFHFWHFVRGFHRPRWFPSQKARKAELRWFLVVIWNKLLNNFRVACDLRRHDAHVTPLLCFLRSAGNGNEIFYHARWITSISTLPTRVRGMKYGTIQFWFLLWCLNVRSVDALMGCCIFMTRYSMDMFSALLAISQSSVASRHTKPVKGALIFYLKNKQLNETSSYWWFEMPCDVTAILKYKIQYRIK